MYEHGMYFSSELTKARPNPLRPQFTCDRYCLSASATGETRFEVGKISTLQLGHWWPLGAVLAGRLAWRAFKQSQ